MMTKIQNLYGEVSLQQIEDLEIRKGISFPENYKKFLRDTNGGEPFPDVFEVSNWPGVSVVNRFFGIYTGKHNNLEKKIDIFQDRLPEGFVPIGNDPGGNLICLGTIGEYRGKIYFWDHEDELDEEGLSKMDMSNMYWLANDIFEFLDKLTPDK